MSQKRPHICEQADCHKDGERHLDYKGEDLYFCPTHYTSFVFALWVEVELNKRLRRNEGRDDQKQ